MDSPIQPPNSAGSAAGAPAWRTSIFQPSSIENAPLPQQQSAHEAEAEPLERDQVQYSGLRLIALGLTPFQRYRLEILTDAFRAAKNEAAADDTADDHQATWTRMLAAQLGTSVHEDTLGNVDQFPGDERSMARQHIESLVLKSKLDAHIAGHMIDPMGQGVRVNAEKIPRRKMSAGSPDVTVNSRRRRARMTVDYSNLLGSDNIVERDDRTDDVRREPERSEPDFPQTQYLGVAKPVTRSYVQKKPTPPVSKPPAGSARNAQPSKPAFNNFVRLSDSIIQPRLGPL